MTPNRILIVFLNFLCCLLTFSNSYVLLYHTENSPSVQYYDCIYYTRSRNQDNIQGVKYCRQLVMNQSLQRDFNQSCHNNGKIWSFEELSLLKVSASDVLQWSSSMERANHYSKYLSNDSLDVENQYICNCTDLASFGKFCEYRFYEESTSFANAITKQFGPLKMLNNDVDKVFVGSQLHQNRPCYTTWTCNSGLMCLDWRHICDGKQQCMDGLDEDYCETLEFNECEDDEYRCANGMCIPEEYWLDGDYDCMDWTDEMHTLVQSGENCSGVPSFVCDEHLCPYNQWSCGDGLCVNDQSDRHEGIGANPGSLCNNMRDVNYMCEAVTRDSRSWWTIDGGYCLSFPLAYQTLGLDTIPKTKCAFSLKCALSDSLDQDCECKNATACRKLVMDSCNNSYVRYPAADPILSPYSYMIYFRDHDWTKKKPDRIGYIGQVKCKGYQLLIYSGRSWTFDETFLFYDYIFPENHLCSMGDSPGIIRNKSGPHYDVNCWNNSKAFNNRSYQVSFLCGSRCISKYRVLDGIRDCYPSDEWSINNSCPQIQRHRLQCSSSELTCLLAGEVGNLSASCSNGRDEFDYESNYVFYNNLRCEYHDDPGCVYLRHYITSSSHNSTKKPIIANNSSLTDQLTRVIPFQSYCNSIFDTISTVDELPQFCKTWICSRNKYRCLSGQCILTSWVCDGEWDCSDGSDEQGIFIIDHLDEHNSELMNLTEMKERCHQKYRSNNTPFSDICDISSEYPCFRTGIDDPFNLTLHRPCINLTQIGDGIIDCLSGLDERNRLQCSNGDMLGFHFQYNHEFCGDYGRLCTAHFPWTPDTDLAYDTVCFYKRKQFKNGTDSNCNSANDVMCLDDICLPNARCNGEIECLHGEDEYRCIFKDKLFAVYRWRKKSIQIIKINLPYYPSRRELWPKNHLYPHNGRNVVSPLMLSEQDSVLDLTTKAESVHSATRVYGIRYLEDETTYEKVRRSLPNGTITFNEHHLPFICNRGLAVQYYTGETVCFCPPSFYGAQCEFYSDRITIVTHLDLTNYRSSLPEIAVIKILTTFLFENEIIDYYEFHVHPQFQKDNTYTKQSIYFLYPCTAIFLQMKKNNPSGTQLYSVRFEAFNLHVNETIEPIGVWQYPIYFDFLPAFRLSKILRFHPPITSVANDLCGTYLCGKNGTCQEIINSNRSSYFCSCHSGYYGIYCESYDPKCKDYCSPKSVCKPKYRGNLTGDQQPLCLCSTSTFGSSCYLKNDKCRQKSCLHGGSCIVTYELDDVNKYFCVCSDLFEGDHCQYSRGTVDIALALSTNSTLSTADLAAIIVSYYDLHTLTNLHVRNQKVYSAFSSHLRLIYSKKLIADAPPIAIMKAYGSNYRSEEPNYYVLYLDLHQSVINITVDLTSENHCPLVETLMHLVPTTKTPGYPDNSTFNSTTAVFLYHHICRAKRTMNASFTCFRDRNYFCICEQDHYRAECFGYNRSTDQCSFCLSNGYCLKGELEDKADFLCLCPRCLYGQVCQYSTEIMSFTLDSLLVKDISDNYQLSFGIYISITLLVFFFGFFNNLSSFLTFIRPKSRKVGVGNYLLVITIIDQFSLLVLLLKIIHIILGSGGTLFNYESVNLYSCKIVSYLLSVFTRITYWLTSVVTIERLYIVLFPASAMSKNRYRAFSLSLLVISIVSGMHVHEVLYYRTIDDPSYTSVNVTLCVISYVQSIVSTYNRVNVLVHYFIPFLIQVLSITILIVQIARSRVRTSGSTQQTFVDLFKRQFKTHKEQYATPIIIILSSLPQIIVSFSYTCTELKQSWQRYTLLTTYFLSYLPQVLGFVLYVLPSTTYSEEFYQTIIGKRFVRQKRTLATGRRITEMKTRPTKQAVSTVVSS